MKAKGRDSFISIFLFRFLLKPCAWILILVRELMRLPRRSRIHARHAVPPLLVLCVTTAGATSATLPPALALALQGAGIDTEATSIWVQAIDAPQPSLSLHAARARNPASVMKLVTAFVAYERFGPARSWSTRLASDATLSRGVLEGNLYVIGSGDPAFDHERAAKLIQRLRALGIERIRGDIILDASALKLPPHDAAAFDGRALRPYNSGPHGLLLNYNTLQFILFPGQGGKQAVKTITEPLLDGLEIDNRITTADGPCQVWHRNLEARLEDGQRLVLSGSLPASCGPRTWSAAPLDPEQYASALVATLWREAGGQLDGRVRSGLAPLGALTLLTHESPPLTDIVRDMNKWSSNLIARQLLANLAATASTAPEADMVSAGAEIARLTLAAAGLSTTGLHIENGSGLSRIERVRADMLGQMLKLAWQRPWMPEFIAALPIAGLDGTAQRHLQHSPARGQAHIKTGTLNGVRAIAGYVLDREGRRHVVVMMVNHPAAASAGKAFDALLEWVWSAPH